MESKGLFNPDVHDLENELRVYILAMLTKANERPSPVVAEEMTREIMRRVSMIATTPVDIPPAGGSRIFCSSQNRQAAILRTIDKTIVDMSQGDKGDPI